MVVTCISLMANNVGHLFMSLFAISMSSLLKCLFKFLFIFDQVVCFLMSFQSYLHIQDMNRFLDVCFADIFS